MQFEIYVNAIKKSRNWYWHAQWCSWSSELLSFTVNVFFALLWVLALTPDQKLHSSHRSQNSSLVDPLPLSRRGEDFLSRLSSHITNHRFRHTSRHRRHHMCVALIIIIYVSCVEIARWPLIGEQSIVRRAKKKEFIIFRTFWLFFSRLLFTDRSQSFSARPRGDTQFQRLSQQSSSTSQLQSDPSQTDFGGHGSSSTITSSAGGSSGGIAGSPQTHMSLEGIGEHTSTPHSEMKHGKQQKPNARSESYKECSPKRSRTNRPKSDPSLYEWVNLNPQNYTIYLSNILETTFHHHI